MLPQAGTAAVAGLAAAAEVAAAVAAAGSGAHRRRFNDKAEARPVATLRKAAAAAGARLVVVPCTTGGPLEELLAPLADVTVVGGVHDAALTTAEIDAWAPAPAGVGGRHAPDGGDDGGGDEGDDGSGDGAGG